MSHWLIELAAKRRQLLFELENAAFDSTCLDAVTSSGHSAHIFCFACVQRRGAL
jgi:hypothetical protein